MKDKQKTPYQRLLDDIKEWACKVRYRHESVMWNYPKGRLKEGWQLTDLWERVAAAEQLGYDVQYGSWKTERWNRIGASILSAFGSQYMRSLTPIIPRIRADITYHLGLRWWRE